MAVKKKVEIIPTRASIKEKAPVQVKKRVAAYCRVSTDSEEQKESYANQLKPLYRAYS